MGRNKKDDSLKRQGRTVYQEPGGWEAFDNACQANGVKPSKIMNELIKGYVQKNQDAIKKFQNKKTRMIELFENSKIDFKKVIRLLVFYGSWQNREIRRNRDKLDESAKWWTLPLDTTKEAFLNAIKSFILQVDVTDEDISEMEELIGEDSYWQKEKF